jgi:selenocysteine lyase/cysteine desulfurase
VNAQKHYLREGAEAFEDGTIDYLNLPAVEIGLKHVERIGIETIHERVACLTGWLLDQLVALKHSNGAALARIYGPITTEARGGTISLNFYDPDGVILDYRKLEGMAYQHNISLRTGCFCNPGAGETALGLTEQELCSALEEQQRMTLPELMTVLGRILGAIRISLGVASNFADAYQFVRFARTLIDRSAGSI